MAEDLSPVYDSYDAGCTRIEDVAACSPSIHSLVPADVLLPSKTQRPSQENDVERTHEAESYKG